MIFAMLIHLFQSKDFDDNYSLETCPWMTSKQFLVLYFTSMYFCRAVVEWSKIDFHPSITCFCWKPLQDKSTSTHIFNKQSQNQASVGAQKGHVRLYGTKINYDYFVGRLMKLYSVRGTNLVTLVHQVSVGLYA